MLNKVLFIVFVLIFLALITGCGGPAFSKSTISNDLTTIFKETRQDAFLLDGDIILSVDGERHSAGFLVKVSEKGEQIFKVYSFLIGDLVTLKANKDSLFLKYEKNEFKIAKSEGLQKLPFFSKYPFSFSMFARILTNRLPYTVDELMEKGEYSESENGGTLRFEKDGFYFKMKLDSKKSKKSIADLTSTNGEQWKLRYSNFKDNRFEKITFNDERGNGFVLTYKN